MEILERGGARVFALTGGIGTGKSSVARIWRDAGLPVVDADQLARDVVLPGAPAYEAVIAEFGDSVLSEDGSLDRPQLGALVFGDEEARARLNSIIHPEVRRAAESEFARLAQAGAQLICYEIPLLFETGQEDRFRPVVVVTVTPLIQMERVAARDGLSPGGVAARVRAQMPLSVKEDGADILILNGGTLDQLKERALAALDEVRQFFAD